MRLLVTRPKVDADTFAELLIKRGHEPVIAPVMEVMPMPGPPVALDAYQAVLATSANGVRALAARSPRRDLPLYAVGPQTAEAARSAGFEKVLHADGDAAALVDFVANHADPAGGALLHASGEETAGRLRQALQARGFKVESVVLYAAYAVAELPTVAAQALREGTLDGVLFFSPRSAKSFATLVTAADLGVTCTKLTAYGISAATSAALAPLTFARVVIAGGPNQEAMLALLSTPAATP